MSKVADVFCRLSVLTETPIPNSISVALALGVQEYRAHCLATICLIDCQTVASQCATAQCLKEPLLNHVFIFKNYS